MSTPTPNMNLQLTTIGVDSGLTWEINTNQNATTLDGHNHTSGNGVPIPSSGLNINSSLPFNGQSATGLQATQYQLQPVPLSPLTMPASVYFAGVDLYANDGAGNTVRITSGGSVNATSSGITNGTASASFVSGSLAVKSSSSSYANVDLQSVVLSNPGNTSNQLTLAAPTLSGNSQITLPNVPSQVEFLTIDSSGNVGATTPFANGIARTNLASVGQQISASSGDYFGSPSSYTQVPNLSVTITTTGRPVMIMLQPDSTNTGAAIQLAPISGSVTDLLGEFQFKRNTTAVSTSILYTQGASSANLGISVPPGNLNFLDTPSAGTYTYALYCQTGSGFGAATIYVSNCVLVAYEL